jgi:uncharacterized protein
LADRSKEQRLQHQVTPFGFVVVLEPGDELIRSLIRFARQQDVDAGAVYGIGSVRDVELGFYRPGVSEYARRRFEEPLEACSIIGNISLLDGEPFPHVHGTFARADFSTVGGHIFEALCSVTLELSVHTAPFPWERREVDFCNLRLMQLEAHR